jgi:hypothetical protein
MNSSESNSNGTEFPYWPWWKYVLVGILVLAIIAMLVLIWFRGYPVAV